MFSPTTLYWWGLITGFALGMVFMLWWFGPEPESEGDD